MIPEDALQQAIAFLDRRFGLDVLWLFGSEAQGIARADSDVDFAALFRQPPTPLEIFDAQGDLAEILHRDVDLVDLDQASPILGMQVLRHGRLLLDRDPRRRLAFFSWTVSMYEDLQILWWKAKASPEEIQAYSARALDAFRNPNSGS
ncbi:MAG TPA: nucleotidyltransferase domain-containing protein [Thermoanaerobaculia bacterium]|nr:nucleotidyltransferase domain-containing protein [Thermoanaerobaculia bacterium]